MSLSKQAGAKQIRQRSPIVDAVSRELERKASREDLPLLVRLAEIFLAKAAPSFLQERSVEQLAQITVGVLGFLQRSRAQAVDVEVLNPELESEGWYAPVTVIRTDVSERPFIVDTIREYLRSQDLTIEHFVYPVLYVERRPSAAPRRESGASR
jgi:NAD-specific glutamate dehydrogenase